MPEHEAVEWLEVDIDIAVLQELVVEVAPGKIRIEGQQPVVFSGSIRKCRPARAVRRHRAVAGYLGLGSTVVLLCGRILTELVLDIGTVHVGVGKVGIQLYGPAQVIYGVLPAAHLDEEDGAVVVGQHIVGVDVQDAVVVIQGVVVIAYLRAYQSPVVERQGVVRLPREHLVEVAQRALYVLELISDESPVEIGERIGRIDLHGPVQVSKGILQPVLGIVDPRAADISLGVKTPESNGPVVVAQGPGRIAQEEVGCSAVEIGIRLTRFLADEAVEILHRLLELLRQEISHAAAEIQAVIVGAQVHRMAQVLYRLVVVAQPASGDGPVMVRKGIHGVEVQGTVEVRLGAREVPQIVLGYAAEKIGLVEAAVQADDDVEVVDGLSVLPLHEGSLAAEEELVYGAPCRHQQEQGQKRPHQYRHSAFHARKDSIFSESIAQTDAEVMERPVAETVLIGQQRPETLHGEGQ